MRLLVFVCVKVFVCLCCLSCGFVWFGCALSCVCVCLCVGCDVLCGGAWFVFVIVLFVCVCVWC